MTSRLEPPLLDEHDHHHEHDGDRRHDHPLTVIEEPLDPASQSLSDALRASFRVLKAIMLVVVVLFVFSGVYRVGQNEAVIVSRLGALKEPAGPGLHFAWPYPIDERIVVQTSPQTLPVETFWLRLSDAEKALPSLTDLSPRGDTLDPATDGALLTGDRCLMHLLLSARYSIRDPLAFVKNVSDKDRLIRSVIENSAIAVAAGSTSDDIQHDATGVAQKIRTRAQRSLDELHSGITIEDVTGKSFYPLATKDAFLQVTTARNTKEETRQGAFSEQSKKLNGVAGPAWKEIYDLIQQLDQHQDPARRGEIRRQIGQLLTEKATGDAGGKINLARSLKEQVIADAKARKATFEAYLPAWQSNGPLLRERLRQRALTELFDPKAIVKIILPAGDKQVFISLNKDPVQAREIGTQIMTGKVEGQK
ncbi:MAG: hypothetical protein AMXMBFR83_12950 [Phycisphaerae bacterium]